MLTEKNSGRRHTETFLDKMLNPELVAKTGDHRLSKQAVGAGKGLHTAQEHPFKFEEGLFEEDYIVQIEGVPSLVEN